MELSTVRGSRLLLAVLLTIGVACLPLATAAAFNAGSFDLDLTSTVIGVVLVALASSATGLAVSAWRWSALT